MAERKPNLVLEGLHSETPADRFRFWGRNWGPVAIRFAIARIPGGWLVLSMSSDEMSSPSIAFVPDPNHSWDGGSLPSSAPDSSSDPLDIGSIA